MIPLIPYPAQLEQLPGLCVLSQNCRVVGQGDAADLLRGSLAPHLPSAAQHGLTQIDLICDPSRHDLGDEGFTLDLRPNLARAVARDQRGLRHAAQTLRQLLHAYGHRLPALAIVDIPRFPWRGVMLDVARHFRPIADIFRLLELAALHRLNVFHWHLTDDQGWRIEIPSRPRLTDIGAWRPQTLIGHHDQHPQVFDGTPHGGFYTQAEIRRVVAHAARLGITVLPEIDLPGHMQCAIDAYPELGNGQHAPAVRCTWGISTQILNCEPATFAFIDEVLSNVLELFPSPLIHLGGDEVPTTEWEKSPAAQQRAAQWGLPPQQLQQQWTTWSANWLAQHGRRLIGWDELHERCGATLPAQTSIMAWRGDQHAVAAAQAGCPLVNAPQQPTYLDHYQANPAHEPLCIGGLNSLEYCANWDPVPFGLRGTPAEKNLLGVQAQLWTEYMPTREKLDYMAFPRLCAIAEAAWTPDTQRSNFLPRLAQHVRLLDRLDVQYRRMTP